MKSDINTPNINDGTPNTPKETTGYINLYRGIWVDTLVNNQKIPIGGSNMFHDEMDKFLVLDFDLFDTNTLTMEKIKEHYNKTKQKYLDWIAQCNCKIDEFDYFVFINVLSLVCKLLKVDFSTSAQSLSERETLYAGRPTVNLSETVGVAACAEMSFLGKYILQHLGYKCSYMSGVTIDDPFNEDDYPEEHSFIVIDKGDKSLIFDISRPLNGDKSFPDILETDIKIDNTTFMNQQNCLVGATRLIGDRNKVYFGVGKPLAGRRKLLTPNGIKTTENAPEDNGQQINQLIQKL